MVNQDGPMPIEILHIIAEDVEKSFDSWLKEMSFSD